MDYTVGHEMDWDHPIHSRMVMLMMMMMMMVMMMVMRMRMMMVMMTMIHGTIMHSVGAVIADAWHVF